MDIELENSPKKIDVKLVKQSVEWFLNKLLGDVADELYLTIKFINGYKKKYGTFAIVAWLDQAVKSREFVIELDSNMSEVLTLKCLAHECVHIKQYALGELRDYVKVPVGYNGLKKKWQGQIYDLISEEAYWDLPWEIEAHGREIGLVDRFLKHIDKPLIGAD
jgi:hypothetical protein